MNEQHSLDLVVITGMSGAGKTVAMQCFEDMGYFCVDNLPPSLFQKLWEVVQQAGTIKKMALVIDIRAEVFFQEFQNMIEMAKSDKRVSTSIMFLDASDEELVARYKENRRSHPMAMAGMVSEGIAKERDYLRDIREQATLIVDTTRLSSKALKARIMDEFGAKDMVNFHIEVESFGFKYGAPIDADVLMDVRFLPNPYYIPELRPLTGQDAPVYDYVMSFEETQTFYERFKSLLDFIIPGYEKEGKKSVTIAIGCTGGQHRSVALTEKVGHALEEEGYPTNITHRDKEKSRESVTKS